MPIPAAKTPAFRRKVAIIPALNEEPFPLVLARRLQCGDGVRHCRIDQQGLELEDIHLKRPTLEDVFIKLTGKSLRE